MEFDAKYSGSSVRDLLNAGKVGRGLNRARAPDCKVLLPDSVEFGSRVPGSSRRSREPQGHAV